MLTFRAWATCAVRTSSPPPSPTRESLRGRVGIRENFFSHFVVVVVFFFHLTNKKNKINYQRGNLKLAMIACECEKKKGRTACGISIKTQGYYYPPENIR